MKKININESAYSFENKHTFKEILKNPKVKNCIISFLLGTVVLSTAVIYKTYDEIKATNTYLSAVETAVDESVTENDTIINNLIKSGIVVANVNTSVDTGYHLDNNYLYDKNNNIVDLTNTNTPLFLISCNIDNELFINTNLASSNISCLCLDMSAVDDDFINYLPNTITELSLYRCNYITNLDKLPEVCPNISRLFINAMPSLSNLDFIYNLPNLKEVYISNSAYINNDLLTYLNNNNIRTNVTEADVANGKTIDNIIAKIIKPNMSNQEKIRAISLYVLDNIEYDISSIRESNDEPLTYVLNNNKGVCASYAYLTNVLLTKANLTSFNVFNDIHSWNIVELDNKYYYLDTTQMDSSELYKMLIKIIDLPKSYLENIPDNPSPDLIISPSLIDDIIAGKEESREAKINRNVLILSGIVSGITIYAKSKKKPNDNTMTKK